MTLTMRIPMEEHRGRLMLLDSARRRVAENEARWKAIQDAFFAEHGQLREGMAIAKEALAGIDADVRDGAVKFYQADSMVGKTGIPGITIRETKSITFDPGEALAWAIEHRVALQLDYVAYRKLVLAGMAGGSVEVLVTAAIAADLAPFLRPPQ